MVIWKYELKVTGRQKIRVGDNKARVLSVAEQNGNLVMWVQLDEDYAKAGTREIEVQVVGTGIPFDYEGGFVGTVVMPYGLVWHVYAVL